MKIKNILFVCTGNTCRSPMAETIFRDLLEKSGLKGIRVASRGVGALDGYPASEGTLQALKAAGLDAQAHRARPLTADDAERADVILVMEESHWAAIAGSFPFAVKKTFLLKPYSGGADTDIADPIGGSPEDYEKCRIEIQTCLAGLLVKLKG